MTSDGRSLYNEHMNTPTGTPVYNQAFETALDHAVSIDDMDQLTVLEQMNKDTAPHTARRDG